MLGNVGLTPNEVAALAGSPRTIVEKALEQNVLSARSSKRSEARVLPLYAVALAATINSMGRRLSVGDKKLVARMLAGMSLVDLKVAKVEVVPAMIIDVGRLSRDAIARAERYLTARESFIESLEGVMGGRPVIRGTRLTVAAIYGRLASGDTVDDLIEDYPHLPREAFETALLYAETHPKVGRPLSARTGNAA